jgi:AcrR family transcriptional regulator
LNDEQGRIHLDRRQILAATAACLKEDGYDGTTIRRIAGKLGCAVGSIYRYFTDKRQMLAALTEQPFEELAQHAEAGLPVRRSVESYYAAAKADATSYQLMFWLATVGEPVGAGASRRVALPVAVLRLLDQWARQLGDLAAAQRLWAGLHGGILMGQSLAAVMDGLEMGARAGGAAAELPPLPRPDGARDVADAEPLETRAVSEGAAAVSAWAETEDVCML